jgi:cephalosporin hydroxylase
MSLTARRSEKPPRCLSERRRFTYRVAHRVRESRPVARFLTNQFHKLYYDASDTWTGLKWLGVQAQKFPGDLWVYQEIMAELRPDWIIECGTNQGGSALFLASVCEALGHGRVISVDIKLPASPREHPRLEYIAGSSTSDRVVSQLRERVAEAPSVMVMLDSDHSYAHVRQELRLYGELVTPGSYLIVEDTNLAGHPVKSYLGDGPFEAVAEFLATDSRFSVDQSREKFFLTFNPSGFLRRAE